MRILVLQNFHATLIILPCLPLDCFSSLYIPSSLFPFISARSLNDGITGISYFFRFCNESDNGSLCVIRNFRTHKKDMFEKHPIESTGSSELLKSILILYYLKLKHLNSCNIFTNCYPFGRE